MFIGICVSIGVCAESRFARGMHPISRTNLGLCWLHIASGGLAAAAAASRQVAAG